MTKSSESEDNLVLPKSEENELEKAKQLLADGKRSILVKDIYGAVNSLAIACEIFGSIYGQTAAECGDALFYYGKALLELGRLETGVLGNALEGDEASTDAEEAEEGVDEKGEEEHKDSNEISEKTSDEQISISKLVEDETIEVAPSSVASNTEAENIDKKDVEKEDEEDPSNLQLAWETLDLAKHIFQKHADSLDANCSERLELELKLCDTFQILGEVSTESENYEQAIEDLTLCLHRRATFLPEESRCIAETNYQLGIAYGFNADFKVSIKCFETAISVLELRIKKLSDKTEAEDISVTRDSFYSREKEITEIESILPEIKEKIEDTFAMEQEYLSKLEKEKNGIVKALGSVDASASSNSALSPIAEKPALSISQHLIKKRKPEDSSAVSVKPNNSGEPCSAHADSNSPPNKVAKLTGVTNPTHVDNGVKPGDA